MFIFGSLNDDNLEKEQSTYPSSLYDVSIDEFYKFAVSVDCVVFGYEKDTLSVLLVKRGAEPFSGELAIPGDLVYPYENVEKAAERVLRELTGLNESYLDQAKVFGETNRHPLGRVVTVAYFAIIDKQAHSPKASSWASDTRWCKVNDVPKLAFDHNEILHAALERLRKRVRNQPVGFELLPQKFTLNELQSLYECLLGERFDKSNFRKKMLDMNFLDPLKEVEKNVAHRPAKLFSFNYERFEALQKDGFVFEI